MLRKSVRLAVLAAAFLLTACATGARIETEHVCVRDGGFYGPPLTFTARIGRRFEFSRAGEHR